MANGGMLSVLKRKVRVAMQHAIHRAARSGDELVGYSTASISLIRHDLSKNDGNGL